MLLSVLPLQSMNAPAGSFIGSVCMVTGATGALGKATASALAQRGARVVLVSRDEARGHAVVASVRQSSGAGSVEALHADLSDLRSVRNLAKVLWRSARSPGRPRQRSRGLHTQTSRNRGRIRNHVCHELPRSIPAHKPPRSRTASGRTLAGDHDLRADDDGTRLRGPPREYALAAPPRLWGLKDGRSPVHVRACAPTRGDGGPGECPSPRRLQVRSDA